MPSTPRVDALVFDAYGTLFDVHSVARRCEAFWPGKGAALSLAWRAKQLEYTWLRSLMGRYKPFSDVTRDALAHACEAMQLELGEPRMQALMGEYLVLETFPEARSVLEGMKGTRLAILSNGSPDMLAPLVSNQRLSALFAAVMSVDELKIYKPAPQVYELAVTKLGIAKENIGFVSSNCWDAMGAKSFGFRVYWINRGGAPADRLGFAPDETIASLKDLP